MKNSELSALLERKVRLDQELAEWENQAKVCLQKIIEWADKNEIPKSIIPRDISRLFNKKKICLDNLGLNDLPDEIGILINLTEISAKDNNLKKLPDSFCFLQNLQWVYLQNNQLKLLPNKFANLDNLLNCYLSGNLLEHIPDDIGFMKSLHFLDLQDNPLESLPPNLDKLELPATGKAGIRWKKYYGYDGDKRYFHFCLSKEQFKLLDRYGYSRNLVSVAYSRDSEYLFDTEF